MRSPEYSIRLDKERFTFCAAHFITYGDGICEPLHGHNYGVTAEIAGPLGEHKYVVDFIAARDALTTITRALDHRVLLPTGHPTIRVEVVDDEVIAKFADRRWVFPASDCVLLPVANTTAELLASYIASQLTEVLRAASAGNITAIAVTVDECDGQQATFRRQFAQ